MKRFLYLLTLGLGVIASSSTLSAQQADAFDDAYVRMYATVAWSTPFVPASAQATLKCVGRTTATTTLSRGAALPLSGTTAEIGVRLVPNVTYDVLLSVDNDFTPTTSTPGTTSGCLYIRGTAGYTVELNEVPRRTLAGAFDLYSKVSTIRYQLRLRVADASAVLGPGQATSLRPGWSVWQLSLGVTNNGSPAGTLSLNVLSPSTALATVFNRANLSCNAASSDVVVLGDPANVIQQVIAPQVCVESTALTGSDYELKCYHPSQRSTVVDLTSGYYTFTGNPFARYVVHPGTSDANGAWIDCEMRDASTTTVSSTIGRSLTTKLTRSGTSPNYTWTADAWHTGTTAVVQTVRTRSGADETVKVQDGSGTVAQQAARTYATMFGGEEIVTVTTGTTNPVTTSYQFYADDSTAAAYGSIKTTSSTGGSWQGFEYDADGMLKTAHGPWNDSSAGVPAGFPEHTGVKTDLSYSADAFGEPTRPASSETKVNGVPIGKSNTAYTVTTPFSAFTSHPGLAVINAVRADSASSSTSLSTTTRFFAENVGVSDAFSATVRFAGDDFYRGQIYSVQRPDGVTQAYVQQRGTWNGTAFTISGNVGLDPGSASRVVVITGTSSQSGTALSPAEDGYPMQAVYLIDGKSTREVTIRDKYADVVRTESHVWSGGVWNLVSYVDYTYTLAHQLASRVASNGGQYTATYTGDVKQSETDESGLTISYTWDAAGRLWTVSKPTIANTSVTTTYGYDAAGRVVSESTNSSAGGSTALVSSRTYDDAGRVWTETPAGLGQTAYAYDPENRKRTVTLPGGATRVDVAQIDGQVASITGTSVVGQYYTYAVESDGRRTATVKVGSSASLRSSLIRSDWLGRVVHKDRPGFDGAANFNEDYTYLSNGRLQKVARTGYADTYYGYDALGRVTRTALDVSGGGIATASTDRITDGDQYFEKTQNAWWMTQISKTYPTAGSTATITTSLVRRRLSGFSGALQEEVQTTDVEGNTAVRTVTVDRSTSTVTVKTTLPGLVNSQVETLVNGLSTSLLAPDGLSSTTAYDGFGRVWKKYDSRNKATTVAYLSGSPLTYSVTDQAGNVTKFGYDNLGRRTKITDALNQIAYQSYTDRGQIYRQWGANCNPVEYGYDPVSGDRTTISTFRGGSGWMAASWPATPGTADTTTFYCDPASGLLKTKTDAKGRVVTYTYNNRGQTYTREWARRLDPQDSNSAHVKATYDYDPSTGELTGITYNDSSPTVNGTPAVAYAYTRLGQIDTVTDATGTRDFAYDSLAPWRLSSEALDADYYGGRVLTRLYETATNSDAGVYGNKPTGTITGRVRGFQLGVTATPARDLQQTFKYSNLGPLVAVTNGTRDFIYSYASDLPVVSGYTTGTGFSVSYDYDSDRPLRTKVDAQWSAASVPSVARFDFAYDALGRRRWSKQSGSAFANYYSGTDYSAIYNYYRYNTRGEVETSAMYRGDTPPAEGASPAAVDQLPGRRFEYRYDAMGNRLSSGQTGSVAGGDDQYVPNELNQYVERENNTVHVLGTAHKDASVGIVRTAVAKVDRAFAADVVPPNTAGPAQGSVSVYSAFTAGDKIGKVDKAWRVAAQTESLAYDDDGNLISDGLWDYTYDAENRLISMSSIKLPVGFARQYLTFTYDYLGRRVGKSTGSYDDSGTAGAATVTRYIYDGWALLLEINASTDTITRSYTWGLDLAGSMNATGGVGALLQITHQASGRKYFPAYDGNGNIVALVQDTGALAQTNEYGAFGELLRSENIDPRIAGSGFGFSTKFTDSETGLVYYGHRYYSPSLGRWINRDPIAEFGGCNLYSFVFNNPTNYIDLDGRLPVLIGAGIGFVVDFGLSLYESSGTGMSWSGRLQYAAKAGVGGAISGAIASTGVGLVAKVASGIIGGVVGELSKEAWQGEYSSGKLVAAGAAGALSSTLEYGATKLIDGVLDAARSRLVNQQRAIYDDLISQGMSPAEAKALVEANGNASYTVLRSTGERSDMVIATTAAVASGAASNKLGGYAPYGRGIDNVRYVDSVIYPNAYSAVGDVLGGDWYNNGEIVMLDPFVVTEKALKDIKTQQGQMIGRDFVDGGGSTARGPSIPGAMVITDPDGIAAVLGALGGRADAFAQEQTRRFFQRNLQ